MPLFDRLSDRLVRQLPRRSTVSRWLRASAIDLLTMLIAAGLMGCAQSRTLVGGQWDTASGRTLVFRADGTADVQGMTAGYEVKGSAILINGQPGLEGVRWVSDDEFTAKDVLSGTPGREQRYQRRR
jgi:hypothetical protein